MGNHSPVFQKPLGLPQTCPIRATVACRGVCRRALSMSVSTTHFDSAYPCSTSELGSGRNISGRGVRCIRPEIEHVNSIDYDRRHIRLQSFGLVLPCRMVSDEQKIRCGCSRRGDLRQMSMRLRTPATRGSKADSGGMNSTSHPLMMTAVILAET